MTEAEILDLLRGARANGCQVRVSGGGVSATPPRDGAVGVSTAGLRGIVDLRPADFVVTVRAGIPLVELGAALRAVGRRLPLRPWDVAGRGTIGGAVAAAADGLTAREGFRWRDVVLGAGAALASGEVVMTGASVVKSVAGFDVPKAWVGSRGTIGVILFLTLRIETVPDRSIALSSPLVSVSDVDVLVALCDALQTPPRGLVVVPGSAPGSARVHVLLEGGSPALETAAATLRSAGFADVDDAAATWAGLTADASAPPPSGLVRRVARCSRGNPVARVGAHRAGGWVADVLRQRVTWLEIAPPPIPDSASAALFERVRRAFDPDGLFQPGRGFGAP